MFSKIKHFTEFNFFVSIEMKPHVRSLSSNSIFSASKPTF